MKTSPIFFLAGLMLPLSAAGANPWQPSPPPPGPASSGIWSRAPAPAAMPPAPVPAAPRQQRFGDYAPLEPNNAPGAARSLYAPQSIARPAQPAAQNHRDPSCSCRPPAGAAGRYPWTNAPYANRWRTAPAPYYGGQWLPPIYGGGAPGWGYGGAMGYGGLPGIGGIGPFGGPGLYGRALGSGAFYGPGLGVPFGANPYRMW